jgi:hypothetical protein
MSINVEMCVQISREKRKISNQSRKGKTMSCIEASLKLSDSLTENLEKYPKLEVSGRSGETLDEEVAELGELAKHEISWRAGET